MSMSSGTSYREIRKRDVLRPSSAANQTTDGPLTQGQKVFLVCAIVCYTFPIHKTRRSFNSEVSHERQDSRASVQCRPEQAGASSPKGPRDQSRGAPSPLALVAETALHGVRDCRRAEMKRWQSGRAGPDCRELGYGLHC
jgi:hypothetical protein